MNFKLIIATLFFSTYGAIAQVVMTNNIPAKLPVGSDVEIEVKINKGSIMNFTKYHMDVPDGVDVSEVDSKTGNFTFENKRAKIVWVSVPGEPEFTVKFRFHINTKAPFQGTIAQKFFFLEGGTKKEVDAAPITIEFGSGTPVTSNAASVSSNNAPKNPGSSTSQANGVGSENATVTKTETKQNALNDPKQVPTAVVSSVVPGLTYRVQIASSPTDPGKAKFASLGSNLKIVNEDGSYKVQYGDFNTKEEAVKAKSELSAKGYEGFLVKYQNGVRVK